MRARRILHPPSVPMPLPKEFEGVPELVVEVLSPSNRRYDLRDKRLIYREAGVGEIWFIEAGYIGSWWIDAGQKATGRDHSAGQVCSEVLQGFWLTLPGCGPPVAEPFHVSGRDSARKIDESTSRCLASSLRTPAAWPLIDGQMAGALPLQQHERVGHY
jgi:hypothetical protein